MEAKAVKPPPTVFVEEPNEDCGVERGENDVRVVRVKEHGEQVHDGEEDLRAEDTLEENGDRWHLLLPVLVEIPDIRHDLCEASVYTIHETRKRAGAQGGGSTECQGLTACAARLIVDHTMIWAGFQMFGCAPVENERDKIELTMANVPHLRGRKCEMGPGRAERDTTYPLMIPMRIAFMPGIRLIVNAGFPPDFCVVSGAVSSFFFIWRRPPNTKSLKSQTKAGPKKIVTIAHVHGGERARARKRRAALEKRRTFACLNIAVISLFPVLSA